MLMRCHFNPLIPSMTLDQIIYQTLAKWRNVDSNLDLEEEVKKLVIDYARSIIPEKQSSGWHTLESNCDCSKKAADFNACRTQILSRIEEDLKII